MTMLAYLDPNLLGLPLQSVSPWLAAAAGAAGTALVMSWRWILALGRTLVGWLWRWRTGVLASMTVLVAGGVLYTAINDSAAGGGAVAADHPKQTLVRGKDQAMSSELDPDRLIVVLGMDGLDPDLLEAMMDADELPAFEALRRDGDYGRLQTTIPPESPVVWSTFATGRGPAGHGIFDFIHREPAGYQLDLSLTRPKGSGTGYFNPRHGQPFWERLARAGLSTEVLFAPCSFPPVSEHATVLAGMGVPDLRGNLGQYTLVSSDATWAERDISGRLVGVAGGAATVRFALPGPRVGRHDLTLDAQLTPPAPGSAPGSSDPGNPGRTARLRIDGQTHELAVGQWSPWVRLTFKRGLPGLGRTIHGVCRFYLQSLSPDLNLYITPMQFDPQQPVFPISQPTGFSGELANRLGRSFATLGMPIDTKAYEDGALDASGFRGMAMDIVAERRQLLLDGLDRHRTGLVFCYFGAPDPIQHMFWDDFLKQRLADQGPTTIPEPIRAVYHKMDDILGAVRQRLADRPGAEVIVLSDHGFAGFRRAVGINRVLMDLGYLHLTPGSSDQTKGGPLFQDIDWSRTQAYACGFSSVFVNLRGREGQGAVAPTDKARLVSEIRTKLLAYTDPGTDEHPFASVYDAESIYSDSQAEHRPDLVLGMRPGYRASWVTALGGVAGQAVTDNTRKWRGDHIMQAASVPGIVLSSEPDPDLPTHIRAIGGYVQERFQPSPTPNAQRAAR